MLLLKQAMLHAIKELTYIVLRLYAQPKKRRNIALITIKTIVKIRVGVFTVAMKLYQDQILMALEFLIIYAQL